MGAAERIDDIEDDDARIDAMLAPVFDRPTIDGVAEFIRTMPSDAEYFFEARNRALAFVVSLIEDGRIDDAVRIINAREWCFRRLKANVVVDVAVQVADAGAGCQGQPSAAARSAAMIDTCCLRAVSM